MPIYPILILLLLAGLVMELYPSSRSQESIKITQSSAQTLPDFAVITDIEARKLAFVDFMLPLITTQNAELTQLRQALIDLELNQLTPKQRAYWANIGNDYQEPFERHADLVQWRQAMLIKVDVIPPSLALSQAAKESGWGMSRFAQEGNNLFGQWCFSQGCGLVPAARPAGQHHEVRVFESPQAAVAAYMHNLNSAPFYQDFRQHRAQIRQLKQQTQLGAASYLSGYELAQGLVAYSIRGDAYIADLQGIIRFNQWVSYDQIINEFAVN
ncbi:FlgJ [Thiomicrospira aerophila AL3]|uniref:FlgJ n=1 Tax=Thiomicrospira aerophila AL3 TaxID=717772 RepID=W0DT48_9GAMM|nr:glucosaminidase domain-containing protein [Thiomicrospira aerophila]AHF01617.1 FlgJ [Thiomicrospira aerophila AL3]